MYSVSLLESTLVRCLESVDSKDSYRRVKPSDDSKRFRVFAPAARLSILIEEATLEMKKAAEKQPLPENCALLSAEYSSICSKAGQWAFFRPYQMTAVAKAGRVLRHGDARSAIFHARATSGTRQRWWACRTRAGPCIEGSRYKNRRPRC